MVDIHETAIIYPGVTIGHNVTIGPFCIIGAPAESKRHEGQNGFGVVIGNNVTIHGHATIDAGSQRPTIIDDGAYIMKTVHIGHDSIIHKDVTISPHAVIGGFVEIHEQTNIGMNATIHQRVTIPSKCMVGMSAVITKKTPLEPNTVLVGNPARIIRSNNK
jgi:acyl-[acyl carrier protein]--UDP-N-acetylglucosamine O-acyltransferase